MLKETIDFLGVKIKENLGDFIPEIGIVLGSGLGELADEYCNSYNTFNKRTHCIVEHKITQNMSIKKSYKN